MGRYAAQTTVSCARSREQIETLLKRYGATQFAYATDEQRAMIGFILSGRQVQLTIPLPPLSDFTATPNGRIRKRTVALRAQEQECRRRWRVLYQVILAKFEAIECGVTTMEEEFLAFMALPDGQTVGERILGDLDKVLAGRRMNLLPEGA